MVDYTESIVGIENIFKVLRVDLVNGFQKGEPVRTGVRITVPIVLKEFVYFCCTILTTLQVVLLFIEHG